MGIRQDSQLVGFDADALLDLVSETVDGNLRTFAEYDREGYRVLYASDQLVSRLGGEDAFETVADRFYSFVHLDFVERELFADLSPATGDVSTYLTRLDEAVS